MKNFLNLAKSFVKRSYSVNTLNGLAKSRVSHRSFTDEKISEEDFTEIIKTGLLSPSAKHNQPLSFYICQDKKNLQEISDFLLIEKGIEYRADHLFFEAPQVIFLYWDAERGNTSQDYIDLDAGLCLQNMLLKSTEMGYGTCLVGFSRYAKEKINEIVNPPENEEFVISVAIGKPNEDVEQPKRNKPKIKFM